MGSPGIVFLYLVFTAGWLYLGTSALTDGRRLQGAVGLGLAMAAAALAMITFRKRRNTSG